MSTPSSNTAENLDSGQIIAESPSYWSSVRSNLRNDPVTVTFALILLMLLLSAIFADAIAPLDPYKTSMIKRLKPVGTEGFLLGTDELGRDMLTRLIYGGRLSLLMGITPVVAALFLGLAWADCWIYRWQSKYVDNEGHGCILCFSISATSDCNFRCARAGIFNAIIS